MPSKWVSEEVWRSALEYKRQAIAAAERPGVIYYHHGQLDPEFTENYVRKLRHGYDRIFKAGEPEWQERFNAQRS